MADLFAMMKQQQIEYKNMSMATLAKSTTFQRRLGIKLPPLNTAA